MELFYRPFYGSTPNRDVEKIEQLQGVGFWRQSWMDPLLKLVFYGLNSLRLDRSGVSIQLRVLKTYIQHIVASREIHPKAKIFFKSRFDGQSGVAKRGIPLT